MMPFEIMKVKWVGSGGTSPTLEKTGYGLEK
jgi:hypothetical protein